MAFLDEVKRGLTSTGKQVAKKTKEITSTVQLKSQIALEKEAAAKSYEAIGKKVFDAASDEEEERFKAEFHSIRKSEAKIRELEEQLSEVDGSIFCSECGARIDKSSVFCSHCGTKVEKGNPEISALAGETEGEETNIRFEDEETETASVTKE